jgi:hypothetical protein
MHPKPRLTYAVTCLFALMFCVLLPSCARAQSLCDLLPASAVKAALGITTELTATPNTGGGNGCDYKTPAAGPTAVTANTGDDSGFKRMMFDQLMKTSSPGKKAVSGLGDEAFYEERRDQQIPKYPGVRFTQQSVVFRAKGKLISLIVMLPGNGVPESSMMSFARLALSEPINTLKEPS